MNHQAQMMLSATDLIALQQAHSLVVDEIKSVADNII